MERVDIKRIRNEHGVSQKRLAELTEYNQGFVSLIENGKVKAPQLFLDRLKECLNIEDISVYHLENVEDTDVRENRGEGSYEASPNEDALESEGFVVERLLAIIENQHEIISKLMARIDTLEKSKK